MILPEIWENRIHVRNHQLPSSKVIWEWFPLQVASLKGDLTTVTPWFDPLSGPKVSDMVDPSLAKICQHKPPPRNLETYKTKVYPNYPLHQHDFFHAKMWRGFPFATLIQLVGSCPMVWNRKTKLKNMRLFPTLPRSRYIIYHNLRCSFKCW